MTKWAKIISIDQLDKLKVQDVIYKYPLIGQAIAKDIL